MHLGKAIASLLRGASAKDVVEAIDNTSKHFAAALVMNGEPESKAVKKAVKLTGHEPDDELLHMTIKPTMAHKDPKMMRHWMKQGHYDPKRTPAYLDASGNSIDD